ncbi:MAG: VanW family protein [Clostridia bacterium]|nr:VanW family protein [Clostridia bacterium]
MNKFCKNILYFVIFIILFAVFYNIINKNCDLTFAENYNIKQTIIKQCDDICLAVSTSDKTFSYNLRIRPEAKKYINATSDKGIKNQISLFINNGVKRFIEPEYLMKYCFYNYDDLVNKCLEFFNEDSQDAKLEVIKNSGEVFIKNAKYGKILTKNNLKNALFTNFTAENYNFLIDLEDLKPQILESDLNVINNLRGHFYTSYGTSSNERKSNIERALSCFDGLFVKPNQIISFNEITGRRTLENGYLGAKIIVDGDFVEGVGGGVCQASTTIYNACLVSNIKVIEAHPHSLKVSYILPGFDAMVNYGSSDLKFQNTTDHDIVIATKCDGERCEVFIYGEENKYKIKRNSEMICEIEPESTEIVEEYDGEVFSDGFVKYPKNWIITKSSLEYYLDDKLVTSKAIRNDKYKAVRGVRLISNNNNCDQL